MIRIISILFTVGLSTHSFAQTSCDSQKQIDSTSLLTFSKEFKKAVMSQDMNRIANFFDFPFRYIYCDQDRRNKGNKLDTLIDRHKFVASKYEDFFGLMFMEKVSQGYIYQYFKSYTEKGECKFMFSYPAIFYSEKAKSLCKQHFFSVEKINGRYKLTSSWLAD